MPQDKSTLEVMIEPGRVFRLADIEPRDLFAVLNGLKQTGRDPQFRLQDEELQDWTCWQPTTIRRAA